MLVDHLGGDLLALELGGIDDGLVVIGKHEDVEADLVARLRVELLDVEDVALGNLILLATSRNDCVHVRTLHLRCWCNGYP